MSDRVIALKNIEISKDNLRYIYNVSGDIQKYFYFNSDFTISYDENIETVPTSIAAIPFVCNVITIAQIFNAEVILDELDKDFYDCIDAFTNGYKQMYPEIQFKGKVSPRKIVETKLVNQNKVLQFFSGGVDSVFTLISHYQENPYLFSLWGADIEKENSIAWENANQYFGAAAKQFDLPMLSAKSSFRRFINESALNLYLNTVCEENWWHGFQHSIGMIGHVAPYAYLHKIKMIYFASTFSQEATKYGVTCASDPSIDNHITFFGCRVVNDGNEYSRQQKINRICQFSKEKFPIKLRVCFRSIEGTNCCECEKCTRTAFGIFAEKFDPKDFGLFYDKKKLENEFNKAAKEKAIDNTVQFRLLYQEMQVQFKKNYKYEEVGSKLKGFYTLSFDEYMDIVSSTCNKCEENNEIIKELRSWIADLEMGKYWLEKHSEELEKYIQELIQGKEWLENHSKEQENYIQKLLDK